MLESDGTLPQMFPVLRQMFSRGRAAAAARRRTGRRVGDAQGDPYVALLDAGATRGTPMRGLMSLVSYAEARTYMHDVLLRDTDQMSMAHGLEVRVPLLDHRLVEYVMGASRRGASSRTATPKRAARREPRPTAAGRCVSRPKRGFVLPFDRWMRGALRPFCEHHLGAGRTGRPRRVSRGRAVAALWQSFLDGRRPHDLVAALDARRARRVARAERQSSL